MLGQISSRGLDSIMITLSFIILISFIIQIDIIFVGLKKESTLYCTRKKNIKSIQITLGYACKTHFEIFTLLRNMWVVMKSNIADCIWKL